MNTTIFFIWSVIGYCIVGVNFETIKAFILKIKNPWKFFLAFIVMVIVAGPLLWIMAIVCGIGYLVIFKGIIPFCSLIHKKTIAPTREWLLK